MLEAPVWFFPDFVGTDRRHSAAYLVWGGGGGRGVENFLGNIVFSYRVAVGIARLLGFVFFPFLGGFVLFGKSSLNFVSV